jgi:hypothetical protein
MGKTVFRNNSKYSSTFSSVLIFSSSEGISFSAVPREFRGKEYRIFLRQFRRIQPKLKQQDTLNKKKYPLPKIAGEVFL